MHSVGTPLLWSVFFVLLLVMISIDLFSQRKNRTETMSFTRALVWSIVWFVVALMFNLFLWFYLSKTTDLTVAHEQALAFFTGYLIEKSLAIDNVFVWLMIFNYFSISINLQKRVLLYGIAGAIILRAVMIFAGSWLINEFQWILYLFGLFLIFTAIKMFLPEKEDSDFDNNFVVIFIKKHLRMHNSLEGERFFIKKEQVYYATPLFLVLILIELSDVIFAVDSIPAIFAVTRDPFIVLTSNLFAILGLRAMYFLLANVADRFTLLKYGLALILLFIGSKMLLAEYIHIPVLLSLAVVGAILLFTLLINLFINKRKSR